MPSLADEVVLLRGWRQTDIPSQLEAFSDPWFLRFSDWAPRTDLEAHAYLVKQEQARQRGERIELAVVEPLDEHLLLGGASLNNISLAHGRAAIGYWLMPTLAGAASRPMRSDSSAVGHSRNCSSLACR